MELLIKLGWLALAGALGTLCRVGLSTLVQRACHEQAVWGTAAVNLLGCLCFGLVAGLADERKWIGPETRLVVLSGFMGAFTTFSTFAFDTHAMARSGNWTGGLVNLLGQNALGLAAMALGLALGPVLARRF